MTTKQNRFIISRPIKTKEEAEKIIKNAAFATCVITVFSVLEGIGTPTVFIRIVILGVIGFLLQKRHSRGAAIAMFSLGVIDLISRIATGANGFLITLMMLYYGFQSIQATFVWHNFEKHNVPASPAVPTSGASDSIGKYRIMGYGGIVVVAVCILIIVHSLSSSGRNPVIGGLYSVKEEDGAYSVIKVLHVDDSTIHLRAYSNYFEERPTELNPEDLYMGDILEDIAAIDRGEKVRMGIGHFPLAKEAFPPMEPVFIMETPVSEEELEGYRSWLSEV